MTDPFARFLLEPEDQDPFDQFLKRPKKGSLIKSAAAGLGIASETSRRALTRGAEALGQVPGIRGGPLGALAPLGRLSERLVNRLRGTSTSEEALAQLSEVQQERPIAGFAGEIAGTIAQIGLTPSGVATLGRLGVSPGGAKVLSGILRSIPVSALQSYGSQEFGSGVQGMSNLLRQFGGERGAAIAEELEPILNDPAKRTIADGVFDAALGTVFEGLGIGGRALGRAGSVAEEVTEAGQEIARARRALPRASQIPQEGVPERLALPPGPRPQPPVDVAPVERQLTRGRSPLTTPSVEPGRELSDAAARSARGRALARDPFREFLIPEDVELPAGAPDILGGTRRQLREREVLGRRAGEADLLEAESQARQAREGPIRVPGRETAPVERQLQSSVVGPAAVRVKETGQIFTGGSHTEAQERALQAGAIKRFEEDIDDFGFIGRSPEVEDGFVDRVTGQFLDRSEAGRRAVRSGQIERDPGSLISEQVPQSRAARALRDISESPVDEAIVEAHARSGGATFDPRTGKDQVGQDVWAVSPFKDREVVLDAPPDAELIAQYRVLNAELLEDPKNMIGTWFDQKNNRHVLDIVHLEPDQSAALRIAREANQDAIFNLKTFQEVQASAERGAARSELLQGLAGAGIGAAAGGAVGGEEGALAGLVLGAAAGSPQAIRRLSSQLGEAGAVRLTKDDPTLKVTAELFRVGNPLSKAKFKRIAKRIGVAPDEKTYDRAVQLWFDLTASTANGVTSLKELDRLTRKGFAGAQWYDDALPDAQRHFGKRDGEMFIKFLAVTSQNTAFRAVPRKADNITLALKAFREWKEGIPFGSKFQYTVAHKQIVKNLQEVASGRRPSGPKIGAFMDALLGDENAVVVDRWMNRAFGFTSDVPTTNQRKFITEIITADAKRHGLTPRQYQAAIWEGALREAGRFPKLPKGVPRGTPSEIFKFRIERAGGFANWIAGEGGQVGKEVLQAITAAGAGAAGGAVVGEDVGVGPAVGAAAGAAVGAGLAVRSLARGSARRGAETVRAFEESARLAGRRGRPVRAGGTPKRPEDVKIKFGKFGLSDQGTRKIEQEARRILETEPSRSTVRVTDAERIRIAKQMGMEDIKRAELNGDLDGTTLLAIRNVYQTNEDEGMKLLARLRDRENLSANDIQRLQANLTELGEQNRALLKAFMTGASEAGRTLQSLKIMASRNLSVDNIFSWRQRLTNLAGRELLDDEIDALRGILRVKDKDGLVKFARKLAPPLGPIASLLNVRRASLLTGFGTQPRNFLSNFSEAAMRQADNAVALGADILVSRFTGVRSRADVLPRWRNAKRGAERGARLAKDLVLGRREFDPGELRKFELRGSMLRQNLFMDSYVRFMFRMQGAADQPFRQLALYESLSDQAKVLKRAGKLTGDIDDIVDAAVRSIDEHNPNDLALAAIHEAEEAVFQNATALSNAVTSGLIALQRRADRGSVSAKVIRNFVEFVIPFRNTPAAIFTRFFERSPAGLILGVNDLIKLARQVDPNMTPDAARAIQRDATKRVGRGVTGSIAMYLGYKWFLEGKMSGRIPSGGRERDLFFQSDKLEDAVLIKGKWHRLTGVSPLGNLVAFGAQVAQDIEELKRNDIQVSATVTESGFGIAQTLLDQSFLFGLQETLDAIGDRPGARRRFLPQSARSFIPIGVKDLAEAQDAYRREIRSITDGPTSSIPYARLELPVQLDEFGRPRIAIEGGGFRRLVEQANPFGSKTPRDDPILKELNEIGARVPRVGKRAGESNESHRARKETIGRERIEGLELLFETPAYGNLTEEQKVFASEEVMRDISRWLARKPEKKTWRVEANRAIADARKKIR